MKILITGGDGFVGRHLNEWFTGIGHEVISVDRATGGADITSYSEAQKVITSDVDAVIHLAALVRIDNSISNPVATFSVNVRGTFNVLEAVRMAGIKKVVFASSADVYGTPMYSPVDETHPLLPNNPYAASKVAGEALCYAYGQAYNIDVSIGRFFNIYGPGNVAGVIPIFVNKVLSGEAPTIQGDGSQVRDYIYISDVVDAYDFMLTHRVSSPLNFGTGVGTTTRDLAWMVIDACGSGVSPIFSGEGARPSNRLVADMDHAGEFRWAPKVRLSDGIRKYVDWVKV